MKNFESYRTTIGKEDQKRIFGGVVPPTEDPKIVGTRYYEGECFCDYLWSDGWEICDLPCPVSNCCA